MPDQTVIYMVYAGGVRALEADLSLNLAKDRYNTKLSAKTFGLLGKLAPWEGVFETSGWNQDGDFKPEVHRSISVFRGEKEVKKYSYAKDGSFEEYTIKDHENDGKPKEVSAELTDQTQDVLSATFAVMQSIANGEKCEGTTDIFDGKRRYKLIFNHKADVDLQPSRYNAYHGPAVECTVEVEPVAGKWHEKPRGWMSIQEQGRARGTMPTVWFAKVEDDKPTVPVKVRVKTSYGTLFMHMKDYKSSEHQQVAKSETK